MKSTPKKRKILKPRFRVDDLVLLDDGGIGRIFMVRVMGACFTDRGWEYLIGSHTKSWLAEKTLIPIP